MQYRRTPLEGGYSPGELLNGRQIRCKLDALLPSPAHVAQGKLASRMAKSCLRSRNPLVPKRVHSYAVGTPCYAWYCGPKRDKEPRWVPALVTKVFGARSVQVRVAPRGPLWKRHIEQLRPRYGVEEDADPGLDTTHSRDMTTATLENSPAVATNGKPAEDASHRPIMPRNYGPDNPRRSKRLQQKRANKPGAPSVAGRCCGC
ncbi:hypothetical protein M513_13395 [Trichuris suis]|nr:hypothetical protein M513_13395 [Trichuris suis]